MLNLKLRYLSDEVEHDVIRGDTPGRDNLAYALDLGRVLNKALHVLPADHLPRDGLEQTRLGNFHFGMDISNFTGTM